MTQNTLTSWTLDMIAIVVGVVLAELILDALHERQRAFAAPGSGD